jgi:hypothetical protein
MITPSNDPSVPTHPPSKDDQHRAKETEYWKKQVFWQRLTTWVTGAAVLVAAIYACFAHQQVTAMRDAVSKSQDLVTKTQELVAEQRKTTHAAEQQAAAALSEANTAQQNLEASERPWIEVIATPITPLTFDKAGGHITLKVQLINHGKSPAVNVFAENDKFSGDPFWTLDYQKKCAQIREKKAPPPGLGIGVTVFPNTPHIDKAVYQLNEADILATEKKMSAVTGSPWTTIEPQIFGCYVYSFGDRFYSTDFRYEMFVPAPDNPKVMRTIKPEGTVPLSKLVFRTSLVGNNAY